MGLGTPRGWSSPLLEALGARAAPSLLQKHESLPRDEVKNLNAEKKNKISQIGLDSGGLYLLGVIWLAFPSLLLSSL